MSGWPPQENDPRRQRPATPPQWQQPAPPGQPQWQPQQQPQWQPQPYAQPPARAAYRAPRKRRVFLWVFLGIQVLFIIWIAAGAATRTDTAGSAATAAQQCAHGGWQGLFKSEADCDQHYAHALNQAQEVGKGVGVVLIVVFWCVADFLLGVGYAIYRLASRR